MDEKLLLAIESSNKYLKSINDNIIALRSDISKLDKKISSISDLNSIQKELKNINDSLTGINLNTWKGF